MRVNVGKEERWLRMCAGLLCMACGFVFLKETLPGYLIAISGCVTYFTGVVRWSTLWAMTGRTIQG